MPWKGTVGDDGQLTEVEFTGRIIPWGEAVKQSHADYFPVGLSTWFFYVTEGFAREARAKWQSGWFSKRKLKGLQDLEHSKAYSPLNILDYLAEHLESDDLDRMKEKACEEAFNVVATALQEKDPTMALFFRATQEKKYGFYGKPDFAKFILSSYFQNPHLREVAPKLFISEFLKTIAREDLSQAKRPDAPVVKSLTPLLNENADGMVLDPFKLFEALCNFISVESAHSKGTYLEKVLNEILASTVIFGAGSGAGTKGGTRKPAVPGQTMRVSAHDAVRLSVNMLADTQWQLATLSNRGVSSSVYSGNDPSDALMSSDGLAGQWVAEFFKNSPTTVKEGSITRTSYPFRRFLVQGGTAMELPELDLTVPVVLKRLPAGCLAGLDEARQRALVEVKGENFDLLSVYSWVTDGGAYFWDFRFYRSPSQDVVAKVRISGDGKTVLN